MNWFFRLFQAIFRATPPTPTEPTPMEHPKEPTLESVVAEDLERHEGRRDRLYLDSLGILTFGIGFALGHVPLEPAAQFQLMRGGVADRAWPPEVVDLLFRISFLEHQAELHRLCERQEVDFPALSFNRKRALLNMVFNLGAARLEGFPKMWNAVRAGVWADVQTQALDSDWAHQVGDGPDGRATEVAGWLLDP